METLKEFRNILLGQQIIVHTDHENLTFEIFNSDCVMRWRLFTEEHSPDLRCVPGESDVVADALSRLDMETPPREEAHFTEEIMSQLCCHAQNKQEKKDEDETCPLSYQEMGKAQSNGKALLEKVVENPKLCVFKKFHAAGKTFELICRKDKVVIAEIQQQGIVDWCHNFLGHPGVNRTEETMGQHLWWPHMRKQITENVTACLTCQLNKKRNKKHGHLPEKEAEAQTWDKLCVDLIGSCKINRKGQEPLICRAVTMTDPATGWFENCNEKDK